MSSKVPPPFKSIAHYIKIANENASRDPVIYYWCLFYAVQTAMQLDSTSAEARQYLTGLLTTLEAIKKQLAGNEAIKNETVAQAHIEDFALKLFKYADDREKTGKVDKAVVQAFYTAGHVMDILSLFGEVDEPFASSKKYAKWKSTQIFACLRDGTPYVPSGQQEETKTDDDDLAEFGAQFQPGAPSSSSHSSFSSGPQENQYSQPHPGNPGIGFGGLPSVPQPPARSSIPPAPPAYSQQQYIPQVPTPEYPSAAAGGMPTDEEFGELRKLTKYALSAIDYQDTKAIRDNLLKALALIQKY